PSPYLRGQLRLSCFLRLAAVQMQAETELRKSRFSPTGTQIRCPNLKMHRRDSVKITRTLKLMFNQSPLPTYLALCAHREVRQMALQLPAFTTCGCQS